MRRSSHKFSVVQLCRLNDFIQLPFAVNPLYPNTSSLAILRAVEAPLHSEPLYPGIKSLFEDHWLLLFEDYPLRRPL